MPLDPSTRDRISTTWRRWRARARKLRTNPTPVRFLASRVLWHAGVSERFIIDLADGLRLRFYPSSVSAALWLSPNARNDDAEFLRLMLNDGDSYVDCGANIGHLALVARALVGPHGSVVAIEPNPRIYGYCVGNLELNRFTDVTTHNLALGSERGAVRISDRRDDDQNHVGDDGVVIEMVPLDVIVGGRPVTLLKLDVEGYELNVLRGATRTLAQTAIVYCELSTSNASRFGYVPHEIEDVLLENGFALAERTGEGWTLSRERVFDRAASSQPRTGYNLVAVRTDALEFFKSRLARHGHRVQAR